MKVLMSHSHADAALAARVSDALQSSGLEVWDPDRNLLPGDNWASEVGRALEEAQAMIVLLTPAAANSPHVKREIEYALGARNYTNRLIPVVVGDPELVPADKIPWIVRRMRWFGLKDTEDNAPEVQPIADAILSHA